MTSGPSSSPPLRRFPPAFTLVELIVVLIILGIAAAIIAPRILDTASRRADLEALEVQRLLTIAAQRQSASPGAPLALEFIADDGTLQLLSQPNPAANSRTNSSRSRDNDWTSDPLVIPVQLHELELRQATADNLPLDRRRWRITLSGSVQRPALALQLARKATRDNTTGTWLVVLAPDALAAVRAPINDAAAISAAITERSTDLDAQGRGEQPW